ncbi:YkgJ family cysteine cluster protein [Dehalogenimonas etheniformans]|uniref:Zinc/iron-chelating domain-containing protein n=1 Tax=Dehalogenimonas etheniformans TaxID=1536648 RepID=A0A2P5P700_9CHLR|nr:YkgJ family cysteine cluster protein [Dehalogenimonas etheniformans]PPD58055.1 zinc/iron-chelating domain-containing protein [Dehalogenimonas etheniformans]QNT75404.1 YkgJ family cysteine cluster protein [Dehalogenimonas etheniformans]
MIEQQVHNVMSLQEQAYWRHLTDEYESYLRLMSLRNPMAVKFGVKSCQRCGQCCLRFCTPRPDEIEPIANYLKISVSELIGKYMVIDTPDCKTFFLRWAKHGEEDITGGRIPTLRTYDRGYCIMFNEKTRTCLIHPVRPREARYVKCWRQDNGLDRNEWGISAWKENDIYKFIGDCDPSLMRPPRAAGINKSPPTQRGLTA